MIATLAAAALAMVQGQRCAIVPVHAPGDDAAELFQAASEFAGALSSEGLSPVAGPALRDRLRPELREVGDAAPPEGERLVAQAEAAFQDGSFGEAARLGSQAAELLLRARPSVATEERLRRAELVWGAGILYSGGPEAKEAAAAHFRWALEREPTLQLDAGVFPPPAHRLFERLRASLDARPRGELSVQGTRGAAIYLDGIRQGQVPEILPGILQRRAWLWTELAGRQSFAHAIDLRSGVTAVAIDLDLESHLRLVPEGLLLDEPPGDPEAQARLRRLALAVGAPAIVALGRCAGKDCFEASGLGAASGASFVERAQGPGAKVSLAHTVASRLRATEPVAPAAMSAEVAPPARKGFGAWPWVGVGAAVVAVGVGIFLVSLPRAAVPAHAPPDLAYGTGTGSP